MSRKLIQSSYCEIVTNKRFLKPPDWVQRGFLLLGILKIDQLISGRYRRCGVKICPACGHKHKHPVFNDPNPFNCSLCRTDARELIGANSSYRQKSGSFHWSLAMPSELKELPRQWVGSSAR